MTVGSGLFGTQRAATPHLVQGKGGVAGEVADLRADVARVLAPMANIVVEELTNVPAAAANGIKLAIATVAATVTYSGAQLDGAVGGGTMSPPRNITVTTAGSTPADAPATATINGVDVNGDVISETITVAQTATIANGVKAFAKVTSIVLPVADGTDATLAFGFGLVAGLSKKLKARAGNNSLIREIAAGSVVTNGTIVAAATGLPNGTYSPNSAFNNTNDYAIYYEADAE